MPEALTLVWTLDCNSTIWASAKPKMKQTLQMAPKKLVCLIPDSFCRSKALPSAAKAAALSASEPCKELPTQLSQALKSSSAPDVSCSPPDGRMAGMQLSQEDSEPKQASLSLRMTYRSAA